MDLLNLLVSILIAAVAFVVLDLRNEARLRRHALSRQGFEALRRQVVRHEGTLEAHARSLGLLAPPDARPTTPQPYPRSPPGEEEATMVFDPKKHPAMPRPLGSP